MGDADGGEDKLQKSARREGKSAWDVAAFYAEYFINGIKRLNISQPDELPRATEHIPEQINLIKKLIDKNCTYTIDDGVYSVSYTHLDVYKRQDITFGND